MQIWNYLFFLEIRFMKQILLLIVVLLVFATNVQAIDYSAERSKFSKALKYLKNKNYEKYQTLKEELIDYPLYANLEYKDLHRKQYINDELVIEFIKKNKNSYISKKAYINLIYRLSKRGKYKKLIANYKNIGSTDLHCLYIRAKIKVKYLYRIDEEIIPIWLSSKSQPKSCDYIFRWFYNNKKLSDELVWQRINMSLESGNYSLSKYLIRFLSNKNKIWAERLLKVHNNPKKYIVSKAYTSESIFREDILSHGLDRISKKNYLSAKKILEKINSLYKLPINFYEKKLQNIFILAMQTNQKYIFSDKNFNLVKNKTLEFNLASANYSIYNSNWSQLLKYIKALPRETQEVDKWIYWKGKAFCKTDIEEMCRTTLNKLSSKRSYYGFLAANILKKPINIVNIPYIASNKEINEFESKIQIKRIYELLNLGKKREARKELNYFYENSKNDNLNVLNILFHKWGWSQGAILGFGHTKYFDDIKLRFPILYKDYFDKYSSSNIEKILLYGIARKESIFIQYAKSSAGALGIMQILPKTSYWVLKKARMKKVSKNYLYNKNMNIFIGSYYFKYLFSKKKSYVEAIASYNAGPNAVRKWRSLNKAPEDAWIEYIPYDETRKYIKMVLEYSLVYDWILNRKSTVRVSQLINTD